MARETLSCFETVLTHLLSMRAAWGAFPFTSQPLNPSVEWK
jgi:hypothetical protein